jgi:ABC-type dipeptide/oligopeptide/nickel transport system permease subunit
MSSETGTLAVPAKQNLRQLGMDKRAQSEWRVVARQLRRNRAAMIGLTILVLEIIIALAAPLIAPFDPLDQNPRAALQAPSREHWMGTDDTGRDLLSRVIWGARISLRVGIISVLIGGGIGIALGIIAGFRGGWIDNIIMRFVDLLLAFPGILLALGIIAILGPGLSNVMLAVGISSIPSYTRVARGSTLSLRERDYVTSARSIGAKDGRIMLRYILPNVLPPLVVLATLGIAGAILTAAGLSFIGLGAVPPTPEWGAILTLGRKYINQAWWYTTFPGLAIMITVLGINMLGDALRDALDPKLRR